MLEPMRPIAIISLTSSNKFLIATLVHDLSAALITPFLLASPVAAGVHELEDADNREYPAHTDKTARR